MALGAVGAATEGTEAAAAAVEVSGTWLSEDGCLSGGLSPASGACCARPGESRRCCCLAWHGGAWLSWGLGPQGRGASALQSGCGGHEGARLARWRS